MSTFFRTVLAGSFFLFPVGIGTGVIQVEAGDRIVPFSISDQQAVRVTGRIRNDAHWLMRRAKQGLYGYSRGPVFNAANPLAGFDGINLPARFNAANPLTGPSRFRTRNDRGYYHNPEPGPLGQSGALRVAGTALPTRPSAQIINVDGDLVSVAEERAEGRLQRFEQENVEIRFHTPRQAYDARFPNVIYLDSR